MSLEAATVQDGTVKRQSPVQPLWKDLIAATVIAVLPWAIAWNHHFRGGWLVYALVMSAVVLVALVFRQLGIVLLRRRQG
jgi:hypothetical protein